MGAKGMGEVSPSERAALLAAVLLLAPAGAHLLDRGLPGLVASVSCTLAAVVAIAALTQVVWPTRDRAVATGLVALVVVGGAGTALVVAVALSSGRGAGWTWAGLVAGSGGVLAAAAHWTRRSFHWVLAVAVVLGVALVANLGRQATQTEAARDGRAGADRLDLALAEEAEGALEQAGTKADEAAAAAQVEAVHVLRDAIGAPVSDSPIIGACARIEPPDPDSVLCAAMAVLRSQGATAEELDQEAATVATLLAGDLDDPTRERVSLVRSALLARAKAVRDPVLTLATRGELTEAQGAIAALCTGAGGEQQPEVPAPQTGQDCVVDTTATATSARAIDVLAAEAEVEMAELAAHLEPGEESAALERQRERELVEARADAERPPVRTLTSVAGAAGDALVQALPGVDHAEVPFGLEAAAAIATAAALLALLRALEHLNGENGPATVKFGTLDGKAKRAGPPGKDGKDDTPTVDWSYDEAFKHHVLVNVPEPATAPTVQAVSGATDILDVGDPATKLLSQLLARVKTILAVKPLFTLDATYLERTDLPAGARHEVFVRLRSGRTGDLVRSQSIIGATPDQATRAAGYWAAAAILELDRTKPGWAQWASDAHAALADIEAARHGTGAERLVQLEEAARLAPTSGMVLIRLGDQLDLMERRLEALELSIRATMRHPRYLQARYRLVTSLSTVAGDVLDDDEIPRCRRAQWERIATALSRLEEKEGMKRTAWADCVTESTTGLSTAMLELAEKVRAEGRKQTRRWRCLAQAVRRSERTHWYGLLWSATGRQQRLELAELFSSLDQVLRARGSDSWTLAPEVLDATSTWQARYNLVCALAVGRDPTTMAARRRQAIVVLEQVRTMDGSGALTRSWVLVDPDLRGLLGVPRMDDLCAELAD